MTLSLFLLLTAIAIIIGEFSVNAVCNGNGCTGRGIDTTLCTSCKKDQDTVIRRLKDKYDKLDNLPIETSLDDVTSSEPKRKGQPSDKIGAKSNAAAFFSFLPRIDDPTLWGYEWLHCVADRYNGPLEPKNLFLGTIYSNDLMTNLETALNTAYVQCKSNTLSHAKPEEAAAAAKIGWSLSCGPKKRDETKKWISRFLSWVISSRVRTAGCWGWDVDTQMTKAGNALPLYETLWKEMVAQCCEYPEPKPHSSPVKLDSTMITEPQVKQNNAMEIDSTTTRLEDDDMDTK